MLVEFRIRNFKSFREEQVLSLVASSAKELPDNLVDAPELGKGKQLLRAAIVYGANASGKSNLVQAFEFVKRFVVNSADRKPGERIPIRPFLLDESRLQPSEFEVVFIQEGVPYRYGFIVDAERVYEEWLLAYPHGLPQTWYERVTEPEGEKAPWYFGPNLKGERSSLKSLTRPNVLYLSVGAQFNHEQLLPVYQWFQRNTIVIPAATHWTGLEPLAVRSMHDDAELKENVISLLKQADLGISGMVIERGSGEEVDLDGDTPEALSQLMKTIHQSLMESGLSRETLTIRLLHSRGGSEGTEVPLHFSHESLGTRRMIALAVPLLKALEHGNVLIVDEIDSSLHPSLVRELVKMFNDPSLNREGAQLLFNTHDVTLLDNSLLRRDQIWFTEKATDGATYLYSLQEFKPRKSEALEKNYLEGRYGAIPVVGPMATELTRSG